MKRRWLAVALVAVTSGCGYNRIQSYDEQASAAQGQIEVQLQRRADLIPNLVNTVKGYAQHEQAVFDDVAKANAGLIGSIQTHDPEQMANANLALQAPLGRLLAIAQAYPVLKADQSFLRLQDELTGTENRIAVSRNDYNEAVKGYNAFIRQFPQVLTAKVIGSKPRKYYEVADAAARAAPTVDFSKPPSKP
jgi:LemA protein